MSTGTVTLHSWNDPSYEAPGQCGEGNEDDEGDPPMGTNYNSRLDVREDYGEARKNMRSRDGGRGLRSNVVRPARLGANTGEEGEEGGW